MAIYLILFILTAVLFVAANLIDRRTEYTQPMWVVYALPLLSFVMLYGLRQGWLVDFQVYRYAFEHPGFDINYEPLFVLLNTTMRAMGFDYHGAMCVYVTLPILGYFCIAKLDRRITGLIMILFMMVSIAYLSNTIRWATAGGMACVSLAMLNQKKYVPAVAAAVCVPLLHISLTPLLVGFWILWWLPFLPKYYLTMPLVLASLFITPGMVAQVLFGFAVGIADSGGIETDLHSAAYITDSDAVDTYFAGERAEISDGAGLLFKVRVMIFFMWMIYEGYMFVREHKTRINRMFYVAFIAYCITYFPTFGIELALRIVFFLSIGASFLQAKILVWEFRERRYVPWAMGVALLLFNWWTMLSGTADEYKLRYLFT